MTLPVSQLLRLISILAVLTIHGTYYQQIHFMEPDKANWIDGIGVLLNQLSRFAVPVFVFLSGYGLAIRFRDDAPFVEFARDFYSNRMNRIGIPFLVWTIALLLLSHRIGWFAELGLIGSLWESVRVLLWTMWSTGADYHFYFFTIILWCYLFFPILIRIRTNSVLNYSVLILLLIVQFAYQTPSNALFDAPGWQKPQFPSSFFFSWLFYFYLGVTLARRDASGQNTPSLTVAIPLIALIVSFAGVLYEYISRNNGQDPGNFDHFHRNSVWCYALSVVWVIRNLNLDLDGLMLRMPRLAHAVQYLAGISFTVFLFHTWILRGLHEVTSNLFLKLILLFAVSFALAGLLDRLFYRQENRLIRFLRLACGLPN